MAESFFLRLLESGQVVIENGTFMFLNEFFMLLPAKTFLELREMLIKELGKKADDFMKKLGKYQVSHALKRYSKTIGLENLDKMKIVEFGINVMNLMGNGVFNILSYDDKKKEIIVVSENIPTAVEYPLVYKKSKKPIDSFVCGIWEEAFTRLLKDDMICVETKCKACGDDVCQFEIRKSKQ